MSTGRSLALATLGLFLCAATASGAPSPRNQKANRKPTHPVTLQKAASKAAVASRLGALTPEEARQTVALLDDAYQIWLEEAHDVYHPRPNQPVAAKIVRELQEKMGKLGWPQSQFLGVNTLVMHQDHQPEDAFERDAVRKLRDSDGRVEQISDGMMRVATAVPLPGGCGTCHWAEQGVIRRAAITWAVPIKAAEALKGK